MIKLLKTLFGRPAAPAAPSAPPRSALDDPRLEPLRRPCWIPRVEDRDGEPRASKFSGTAALPAGESWPLCPNCTLPVDDLPDYQELADLGFPEEDGEEISNSGYPREGDKLAGWPYWVQSVEYPQCPECKSGMKLLFQIDSDRNLPYMFGDAGCGHVTYCGKHPHVLAFGWACH